MAEIDARLREEVHLLGELLGDCVRNQRGEAFLAKIEQIRQGAKAGRQGSAAGDRQLRETLAALGDDELLPVARAGRGKKLLDKAFMPVPPPLKPAPITKAAIHISTYWPPMLLRITSTAAPRR